MFRNLLPVAGFASRYRPPKSPVPPPRRSLEDRAPTTFARFDNIDVACARSEPTPHRFETEQASAREDRRRTRRMRRLFRILTRLGRTNWTNMKDRHWLARQYPLGVPKPALNPDQIRALAERLEDGVASGLPPTTLGSSLRMRLIRLAFHRTLLDAFAPYADDDLRTLTVIYSGWAFSPADLDGVTATQVKAQFRQHLNRVGVPKVPGPLFAVLHGEFEPTSGLYRLHFHILTTAAKAAALKACLTSETIKGYAITATGAAPVRRSRVRDRGRQFSYLAKSYWPSRPVVMIDGRPKRVRKPRRIPEPFATQVLLWLDRQSFADLVLLNDVWSPRKGGTAAMKRLYLLVKGMA